MTVLNTIIQYISLMSRGVVGWGDTFMKARQKEKILTKMKW